MNKASIYIFYCANSLMQSSKSCCKGIPIFFFTPFICFTCYGFFETFSKYMCDDTHPYFSDWQAVKRKTKGPFLTANSHLFFTYSLTNVKQIPAQVSQYLMRSTIHSSVSFEKLILVFTTSSHKLCV